ncbi:aromatic ring-hydroxylating dioxygenase subunit alpha [Amycolatopsis sp. K13G38]|uniref:Aromatic ring-hydroxylating dioxygenase subunit alpha n=1 Tax=Amycolatopsis acididurans TaxID=2724524 RepID=A0ABX1IXU8_9PSEU|nr:aromatic ring-hydroxylating dioxygenase subunit alpha [Amycolatopsis acididurans]NKQ51579.1 aromatic ring-hydroxylating dioxygenase subunit alpha [Amycolatopsis acididurans]
MTAVEERRTVDTSSVPFAMRDRLHVPRERYYDRGFYELEKQKLWTRTWQMACRLEEIPEPHDFVEYEICDQSVLVVRQRDGSVKAFHNACRHRATQLAKGCGRLGGGQLVCPFHGWRWNADGTSSFVYGDYGFEPECLRPEDLRLRECRVEVWGGCVWITMDPGAGPLRASLSPAASLLKEIGIDNWQVKWWKEVILNANWKMAQEAFMEGYHVMQTHPQLAMGMGEEFPIDTTEYLVFAGGHSSFQVKGSRPGYTSVDGLLLSGQLLADGQDAMTLERDITVLESLRTREIPDGAVAETVAATLRRHAEGAGIPWRPGMEDSPLFFGGEVFLFPNMFFLPQFGNCLSYRIRPYNDDPEWCRFEVWSLTTYPETEDRPRADLLGRFDKTDTANWGLIPRQDFGNIERQQRGLHTMGFEELRLATRWEAAISNMHVELDKRLAAS